MARQLAWSRFSMPIVMGEPSVRPPRMPSKSASSFSIFILPPRPWPCWRRDMPLPKTDRFEPRGILRGSRSGEAHATPRPRAERHARESGTGGVDSRQSAVDRCRDLDAGQSERRLERGGGQSCAASSIQGVARQPLAGSGRKKKSSAAASDRRSGGVPAPLGLVGQGDAAQEASDGLPGLRSRGGPSKAAVSRARRGSPAEEDGRSCDGGAVHDPESHAILPAKRARSFRRARWMRTRTR